MRAKLSMVLMLLAGCPGTDAGGGAQCMPGALAACRCDAVTTGNQVCSADGNSFGICQCGGGTAGSGAAQTAGTTAGITEGVAGSGGGTSALAGAGASAAGTDGLAGSGAGTTGNTDGGVAGGGDMDAAVGGNPETGRLAGITAAHNAIRANIDSPVPSTPLPDLTWSESLAATAQAYAEKLATTGNCQLVHSMTPGLGENIAYYGGQMASPEDVVAGWASEDACWTYGQFMKTDACDMTCTTNVHSNGCGHYTQLVWRATTQVGCGVAQCTDSGGFGSQEIWVCNYTPQGNFIGQNPY